MGDTNLDLPYRPVVLLAFIVAAGLGARLAWTLWSSPLPPHLSDAEYYDATARSLARGDGYSVSLTDTGFLPGRTATAFFPPGYSALLGATYFLFGERLAAARLANVLAGTLTIPFVYLIGSSLFGSRAGLLAAALGAVFPSLVFWTPVLLSETAFTLIFAAAVWLFLGAARKDGGLSWRLVALGGLVTGLAALVRSQALALAPAAAVWWAVDGVRPARSIRAGALAALAAAAVILPWTVRNALALDAPVVLSTNVGYNLRIGHAPYANGRFVDPADLYLPAIDYQDLELKQNSEGRRLAFEYALDHPTKELELSVRKVRWLWSPDTDVRLWLASFGLTPLSATADSLIRLAVLGGHWTSFALLLAALPAWRRARSGLLFALVLSATWTAGHVLFFAEPRYRLPLLPVVLPIMALGLLEALRLLSQRIGRSQP